MYYCEVSSPQIAYVYDKDADNKLVGIFTAYDAKKVVKLLNAEREAHTTQPSEAKAPRVIDLTEPMPCIVSVKVTEEMIENDEIPF